ncbi:hypothetical protein BD414DRAFT_476958 [Trametes punicea]|nr:hypothetical protein BD414DRAFT_476958 [Trametes punicea]
MSTSRSPTNASYLTTRPVDRAANTQPRPSEVRKKRDSTRVSLARVAAITNAKRRVAQMRQDAPPPAPPLQFTPPEPPIPADQMAAVYELVQQLVAQEQRDATLGAKLVQLMKPYASNLKDQFYVSTATVDRFCTERGLRSLPRASPYYPTRYQFGSRAFRIDRHPVVILDSTNAPFIESVTVGGHGFAYICSPDFAGLPELGKFHLFNRPIQKREAVVNGQSQTSTRWHYNGMYIAHKTPFAMSTHGWRRLPEKTQRAAAMTHCFLAAKDAKSARTAEAIQSYHNQLDAGTVSLPLLLFECVDFDPLHAEQLVNADCADTFAVGRLPSKRIPSRAVIESWQEPPKRPQLLRRV